MTDYNCLPLGTGTGALNQWHESVDTSAVYFKTKSAKTGTSWLVGPFFTTLGNLTGCVAAILLLILIPPTATGWSLSPTPAPGILLADITGQILYGKNLDKQLVPASTLKILTSLAALHYLGNDHRFKTEVYLDAGHRLVVKGYGDPLLTSEAVNRLSQQVIATLSNRNMKTVEAILIDDTFFDPSITIPGTGSSDNPYDAFPGGCSANFNTVAFAYDPTSRRFVSPEPQTPFLAFVEQRVKSSGQRQGRIILSRSESRVYTGMLMRHFMESSGITVRNGVEPGSVDPTAELLATFWSDQTLDLLIRQLMEFSNNFIANQILLTLGATVFSPPATLDKGVKALKAYAENQLNLKNLSLVEGSGISRENRLSPREMLRILLEFKQYHYLMKSGTGEYYKTGTLQGVNTRAGYFTTPDNRLFPFVIMVNAPGRGYSDIQQLLRTMIPAR